MASFILLYEIVIGQINKSSLWIQTRSTNTGSRSQHLQTLVNKQCQSHSLICADVAACAFSDSWMSVNLPVCLFVFVTPWMWCSISEMRFFVIRIFSGAARRALRADAVLCLIIEFSHCSRYRWQVWVTDFLYTANSSGVCWESSAQRSKEFQSGHRMFWKMPQMFFIQSESLLTFMMQS